MADSGSLTLASGEVTNPERGITFTSGLIEVFAAAESRVQANIASVGTAGANIDQSQVSTTTEILNHLSAAKGLAEQMKAHYEAHQAAQEHVKASGAGTNNNYLG
jgi:hypothetical protein